MADRPEAFRHAEAPASVPEQRVAAVAEQRMAAVAGVGNQGFGYVPGSLKIWKWREAICCERS
jgi:hypothetical protein